MSGLISRTILIVDCYAAILQIITIFHHITINKIILNEVAVTSALFERHKMKNKTLEYFSYTSAAHLTIFSRSLKQAEILKSANKHF